MTTALSKQQASDLRACEQTINSGLATFRKVGQALCKIRDERLYKATHKSFEAYCSERWDFGRSYAARLIQAADVPEVLPSGQQIDTERQARKYLDEQKQAAKPPAESKPKVVVAELDFDDDQDTSIVAGTDSSVPLAGLDPDSAGVDSDKVPADRIIWLRDQLATVYTRYIHTFGDRADWTCWLAAVESFEVNH